MIPTEPIGSLPRPPALIEAVAQGDRDDPRLDRALRGRDPRHHRAVRGDRLAGHHRRRAAEVSQLLDLLRPRAAQHRARRLQDSVRRRTHPPHAAADRGSVPLQAVRRQLSRRREALRPRAAQAGGHLAVGAEPDVSRPKASRATRASSSSTICWPSTRRRSAAASTKGAYKVQIDFTEGRLAMKIDPSGHLLHSFIDLNNLALSRFSRRRAAAHRRAHLPRRRSRFDAQRRRRLRRAAAEPVPAEGRQLLHRAGRRTRSRRTC